jgi:hypothetical protein
MAARRTAKAGARTPTTPKKKTTAKRGTKVATKRPSTRKPSARPSLASISAQLTALSEQVEVLTQLVRARAGAEPATRDANAEAPAPEESDASFAAAPSDGPDRVLDSATFEAELLSVLGDLDRRERHAGMVPIPEVRAVFLQRGWTRSAFDEQLLRAERDFVVDLKIANDPARLAEPELAIEEPGRGHLQYVVLR